MQKQLAQETLLKTTEVAILSGVHVRTAIKWRHKLGVKCPQTWGTNLSKRPFPPTKPVEVPRVTDPNIWHNKEWLEQAYIKYGTRLIARIVGRSRKAIKNKFKKFGIPLTKRKYPINPCNTKEWLEEHYVLKGKPIEECAKLAGVNNYTIYNWLATWGIAPRDIHEATSKEYNPEYTSRHPKKAGNSAYFTAGKNKQPSEVHQTPN